ncbi:MAG: cell division control protein Cdc6 [Bacteroidetes bacterium GWA2_40_14]|nr:MAG: cell division control protein Cdc6 [Bacteroidetes bacterium GWA2_40_14]
MTQKIAIFFENYLQTESLFQDKTALQSNYVPEEINYRDDQINSIAKIVAPALRKERPSNLFIYGKTGTGKTVTVKHTLASMHDVAKQQNIPLRICYINCKLKRVADTEYRLIAELARIFGKAVPVTGLPTDEIYNAFFRAIDEQQQIIILVLDEVDQLIKKIGDEIIYNLTRINTDLKKAQLCIIGISNDLIFSNTLDPRVKSSLSEEELLFPPYNALQLQQILTTRAHKAFKENIIEEGVIPKCAAYAAREHGDARRALELLRVAGEIAERSGQKTISIIHIDEAEEKIERDRIVDVIRTQPKQFHATLQATLLLSKKHNNIFTGDIYDVYKTICNNIGLRPLTQRRVSDIIAEMDMLGIINAKIISKGRFGRMREITIGLPSSLLPIIQEIIQLELGLQDTTTIQEAASQEKLDDFTPPNEEITKKEITNK